MDVAETTRPPVRPASPHYGDIAACPRCDGACRRRGSLPHGSTWTRTTCAQPAR